MSDHTSIRISLVGFVCALIGVVAVSLWPLPVGANDSTIYEPATVWKCGTSTVYRTTRTDPGFGKAVFNGPGTAYDVTIPSNMASLDLWNFGVVPPAGTTFVVSWPDAKWRTPSKFTMLIDRPGTPCPPAR